MAMMIFFRISGVRHFAAYFFPYFPANLLAVVFVHEALGNAYIHTHQHTRACKRIHRAIEKSMSLLAIRVAEKETRNYAGVGPWEYNKFQRPPVAFAVYFLRFLHFLFGTLNFLIHPVLGENAVLL